MQNSFGARRIRQEPVPEWRRIGQAIGWREDSIAKEFRRRAPDTSAPGARTYLLKERKDVPVPGSRPRARVRTRTCTLPPQAAMVDCKAVDRTAGNDRVGVYGCPSGGLVAPATRRHTRPDRPARRPGTTPFPERHDPVTPGLALARSGDRVGWMRRSARFQGGSAMQETSTSGQQAHPGQGQPAQRRHAGEAG